MLFKQLPFDADRDLVPITMFHAGALLMAINSSRPHVTPAEYLAQSRRQSVTMGSYSPASLAHLVADTWNGKSGQQIQAVQYKGESPMWVEIANGLVDAGIGSYQGMLPHLQRGVLRPVAAMGNSRNPKLPDMPTFKEWGFRDKVFDLDGWVPMCAPAGTPPEIQARIARAIVEASRTPKLQDIHEQYAIPVAPLPLEEARARWRSDSPVWIELARQTGVKLD